MSALFGWIAEGDRAALAAALAEDPGLAGVRDERGVSSVMFALYVREPEIARLLASTRGDLDVFEAAALADASRLGELLTADPALARAWSPDGFTALHFAAFLGDATCAGLLLERGADPSAVAQNPMCVQPLHSAAAARNLEVARLLLDAGADPNAEQQGGFLPLDAARQNRDEELQGLLREHGGVASR
jgi:ankyrin repeat protein